jgi:hypothetical protein
VGSGKCRHAHVSLPLLPEQFADLACHLANVRMQKAFHRRVPHKVCGSEGLERRSYGTARCAVAGKKSNPGKPRRPRPVSQRPPRSKRKMVQDAPSSTAGSACTTISLCSNQTYPTFTVSPSPLCYAHCLQTQSVGCRLAAPRVITRLLSTHFLLPPSLPVVSR